MRLASQAFQPYSCITNVNASDDSFGFRVLDIACAQVLSVPHIPSTQYTNPLRLAGEIEQVRLDLQYQGRHLEDWTMPFIPDPSGLPEMPPNY